MKITKHFVPNGIEYSNENGFFHREDGPAVERHNGEKLWYQNGLLNRLNGPAIEREDGTKEWCQNNSYHRLDGPAIERSDGYKAWFFNGKRNRFSSEKELKSKILKYDNVKQFIADNVLDDLDPGEMFLLRLVIQNHFPQHLDFLDKFLVLL